ncbi:MAG: Omp28-related outer membrane protein [Saprospiraceae bacterium]|jgi:hypothetical protein|nr:Omp28-related outer membrane protein [Saprospiraceae bacterium]
MRSIITLFFVFAFAIVGWTQNSAKRYILLEHFTNSRCSICASQNPGFFNVIANYPDDVHHVSIHPPVPYNNCVFYLANPSENSSRATYYNITGTPRVIRNGTMSSSAGAVTPAVLNAMLGQTSSIGIVVTENAGAQREADVEVLTLGDQPAGSLRLFAMVVEREVEYNAPNGEPVHHNVFRKMLTSINGDNYVPAATGQSVSFNFEFEVQSGWNEEEIYVLAFVQNIESKEVLNSGTRFDEAITSVDDPAVSNWKLFPNPVNDKLFLQTARSEQGECRLYDATGKLLQKFPLDGQLQLDFDLNNYPTGIYTLQLVTDTGKYPFKIVKK